MFQRQWENINTRIRIKKKILNGTHKIRDMQVKVYFFLLGLDFLNILKTKIYLQQRRGSMQSGGSKNHT